MRKCSIVYYRKFLLYELELLSNKLWYLEKINYKYNINDSVTSLQALRLELWDKVNYYTDKWS